MTRNSFISLGKLSDVKGRICYISSHEKQENLYATYNTTSETFWHMLAQTCQNEYRKSGTAGKCVEARELIIALPECFVQSEPQTLLEEFTDYFKNTYGVECISALHHNKSKTNYHIHLIFSERKLLENPIVKVATRNMFYNEGGKRMRTKQEILNESGEIRKGCKIVPKGNVYERQFFGKKQAIFKDYNWLETIKRQYTELINSNLYELSENNMLAVFNPNGPYMPTQKIGKNNPLSSDIEKSNQLCMDWNKVVDDILATEIVNEAELSVYKYRHINEALETEVNGFGWKKGLYGKVLQKAIHALHELSFLAKKYQQKYCVKSFDIPDESLAEIKQRKAALFKGADWLQAIPKKQKYVPYEKMTVYQKAEFRKRKELERLYGKGKRI